MYNTLLSKLAPTSLAIKFNYFTFSFSAELLYIRTVSCSYFDPFSTRIFLDFMYKNTFSSEGIIVILYVIYGIQRK